MATDPVARNIRRRAPLHHQERRQRHRLARRPRQTEQGQEGAPQWHKREPTDAIQGLRLKLEPRRNADGESELPKLISASLRPDDPFAKRLLSTPVPTSNLLLKVTVPKRTGRKRKRGSSGPFLAVHDVEKRPAPEPTKNAYVDAAAIFRSLQDNASKYAVSVAGVIDETHRFRSEQAPLVLRIAASNGLDLPDIQYASSTSATMANIRDSLMPLDCKQFMPPGGKRLQLTHSRQSVEEFQPQHSPRGGPNQGCWATRRVPSNACSL